jgi:hypothetical protein
MLPARLLEKYGWQPLNNLNYITGMVMVQAPDSTPQQVHGLCTSTCVGLLQVVVDGISAEVFLGDLQKPVHRACDSDRSPFVL